MAASRLRSKLFVAIALALAVGAPTSTLGQQNGPDDAARATETQWCDGRSAVLSAEQSGSAPSSPHSAPPGTGAEPISLDGRWRSLARSPFRGEGALGVWTGTGLLVLDSGRIAAYDPTANRWTRLADAPIRLGDESHDVAVWADGEWIVWAGRDGYAYQPSLDKWREVASVPIAGQVIATVEASNEVIVVSSAGEVASFDLRGDCWRALPAVPLPRPQSASDDEVSPRTLFWTGQDLLLTTWDPPFDRNTAAGSSRLWRLDADGWKDTGRTPLQGGWPGGVWTGAELLFMGGPRDAAGRPAAAAYDPVTGAWREFRQECGPSTADAVWTGELLITPWSATGPSGVECYTLPESDDRARYRPVMVWTGEELIVWSGGRGEGQTARPDGVAFRPAD